MKMRKIDGIPVDGKAKTTLKPGGLHIMLIDLKQPLTEGAERVTTATYEPRDGRYLVFERATGGDEADQLYRLDLPSRQATLLTTPDERHSIVGWMRRSALLLHTSVPLDRTAQGGSRPAMELFVEFRGRKPRVEPLLKQHGLLEPG